MQSQPMHSRQKLIVAPNPIYLFVLSVIVYLILLILNGVLYSGVISMCFSLILFILLSTWNLFVGLGKNAFLKHRWINVLISVFIISIQLLMFCIYSPNYTSTKAADIVELSMENVNVIETHTIDTLDQLNPFVKKGYVFSCEESTTARSFMVFFNPISGDYYEMK